MTPKDFLNKLDLIIANIDQWALESLQEVALTAFAEIVNRIHKEGIPGKSYSENPLPYYYFREEDALIAGGRDLIKRRDTKAMRQGLSIKGHKLRKNKRADTTRDGISYKEWREANGLQVSHVDLVFTGNMFRSMKKTNAYVSSGGGYVVEIYSTVPITNMKLKYNVERYGNFFAFTEAEKKKYAEMFGNILKRKLDTVWT